MHNNKCLCKQEHYYDDEKSKACQSCNGPKKPNVCLAIKENITK